MLKLLMNTTYHALKKRKNDPATCSHAANPPFGGGSGTVVFAVTESVAVVGSSMFASASMAWLVADSCVITFDAGKP